MLLQHVPYNQKKRFIILHILFFPTYPIYFLRIFYLLDFKLYYALFYSRIVCPFFFVVYYTIVHQIISDYIL